MVEFCKFSPTESNTVKLGIENCIKLSSCKTRVSFAETFPSLRKLLFVELGYYAMEHALSFRHKALLIAPTIYFPSGCGWCILLLGVAPTFADNSFYYIEVGTSSQLRPMPFETPPNRPKESRTIYKCNEKR